MDSDFQCIFPEHGGGSSKREEVLRLPCSAPGEEAAKWAQFGDA